MWTTLVAGFAALGKALLPRIGKLTTAPPGRKRRVYCTPLLHKMALLLAAAGMLAGDFARAHTCPPEATATAVGVSVTALRSDNVTAVGQSPVAACETIILAMSLVYLPHDPITLGRAAAFQDGTLFINAGGLTVDVTPAGGIAV